MRPIVNQPGAPQRQLFKVVAVSPDRQKARLADAVGFQFDVTRVLPGVEVGGGVDNVTLEPGITISGVLVGQFDSVHSVVIEDEDFHERKIFETLGPSPFTAGWTPYSNPGNDAGKDTDPTTMWVGQKTL